MHVNAPLAKAYARALGRLAKQLKLAGPVTLEQVARAPGCCKHREELAGEEDFWPAVEKALKVALARLVGMREREGAHLSADLARRVAVMRKAAAQVAKQAPTVAERYRQQLIERIKSAGLEAPGVEDERLLKEVVYFADRSDISEELTRCKAISNSSRTGGSRRSRWGGCWTSWAQEMNREINTIGSKANDSLISRGW